mgnify:CR=1 FL=1
MNCAIPSQGNRVGTVHIRIGMYHSWTSICAMVMSVTMMFYTSVTVTNASMAVAMTSVAATMASATASTFAHDFENNSGLICLL